MSRRFLLAALTVVAVVVPHMSPERARATPSDVVTVDASRSIGSSNQRLVGLGWNTGELDGVEALRPPVVRIDASLHSASRARDELDLDGLLAKVAEVRGIGAEPQVILSYMPAWLTDGCAAGRDPTRVAPCDLDAWEQLVRRVVETLATAPAPAHRFEVWNEPDWWPFWQDSLPAFLDVAAATHRAVASVARDPRLARPLEIGGPATLFADPAWIVPYVERIHEEGLALDFVSWHHYGNYPFLGPDGAEHPDLEPVQPVVGRRNPAATPGIYGVQVEQVRTWVDVALAGSDLDPELVIDEWNLSAGGMDRRHDTNEGAAFVAATLIEMERSGLDAADFYRAADDPDGDVRRGDWGLVDAAGIPKPAWWVFRAWQRSAGELLVTDGDDPRGGLWARATSGGAGRLDVLLTSFRADGPGTTRHVRLELAGVHCAPRAEVRSLVTADGDLASGRRVAMAGSSLDLEVPPQSVVWVRFRGCPTTGPLPDREAAPTTDRRPGPASSGAR